MPDFKDEPLDPVDLSVEHMTPDESDEFDYSDYIKTDDGPHDFEEEKYLRAQQERKAKE
ncbi:TPA: hypothetical protein I7145_20680 [Vibrio vulnificus]|nr:hypothetical protein [Vibrio vulnificus]